MDDLALFREKLAEISNVPPPFLPQWFVDELRTIGGINKYGEANLRVVWGQSREAMDLQRGQLMPKFKYLLGFYTQPFERSIKGSKVSWVEHERHAVGKPAYFIEKYTAPEAINREKWEHEWRWWFDDSKPGQDKLQDIMGPYPERGMYLPYIMIHGAPCQTNLDEIRELIAIEESNSRKSSDQIVADEIDRQDQIANARRLEFEERVQDIFNTYKQQLAGNAVVAVASDNLAPLKGNNVDYIS